MAADPLPGPGRAAGSRVAGVVVDHNAGPVLVDCVRSLEADGVTEIAVVENGDHGGALAALGDAGLDAPVLHSGVNLGYGAGANRGAAATGRPGTGRPGTGRPGTGRPGTVRPATGPPATGPASRPGDDGAAGTEFVLVCNPDLRIHRGAVAALVDALDQHPDWGIVGPRILTAEGERYPSVRPFPSLLDAAGHAVVGLVRPDNPFTRRYRPAPPDGDAQVAADWVSGACFLVRRRAFEDVGGFDERYFMFAEEMDLCWRLHAIGWGVGFAPAAAVTHAQGLTTRRHPYRMLVAHHRSALRFFVRTTSGWRRLLLPLAAAVLGTRLVASCAAEALRRRRPAGA